MIFVTIGMQLGFDRLIEAMDRLAPDLNIPITAQIGKGIYQPQNMSVRRNIAPGEFEDLVQYAQLVVSHAGIGTVLTAQRFQTPIVLFPRRAELGEHRNDHQLATVRQLRGRDGITIADTETDLAKAIIKTLAISPRETKSSSVSLSLLKTVANFIETGRV